MLENLTKKIYRFLYNENSYSFIASPCCAEVENRNFFSKLSEPQMRTFVIRAMLGSSKEVGSFSLLEVEPNRFLIRNFRYSEVYPDVKKAIFRFIEEFTGQELNLNRKELSL